MAGFQVSPEALRLKGTLFGRTYQKSPKTRNWDAAEKIKRDLEGGEPLPSSVPTLKEASKNTRDPCPEPQTEGLLSSKRRILHRKVASLGGK